MTYLDALTEAAREVVWFITGPVSLAVIGGVLWLLVFAEAFILLNLIRIKDLSRWFALAVLLLATGELLLVARLVVWLSTLHTFH